MTHQQILEKAIQKAIDGGFKPWFVSEALETSWRVSSSLYIIEEFFKLKKKYRHFNYQAIIFNHDFVKALWPDDGKRFETPDGVVKDWHYHLQLMVIAEDPIKYLGQNLSTDNTK